MCQGKERDLIAGSRRYEKTKLMFIEAFAQKIVFVSAPTVGALSEAKMIEKPKFAGANEDFEIIFPRYPLRVNAAEAKNMNRAKVSY